MALTPKLPRYSADATVNSSFLADSSLASYQWRLVKKTSTGLALCGSGENPLGVLINKPASGEYGDVVTSADEVTGVAGGAITAGAGLKPASNGKLVAGSSGDECCATALTGAAADGDLVLIHLNRHNIP